MISLWIFIPLEHHSDTQILQTIQQQYIELQVRYLL